MSVNVHIRQRLSLMLAEASPITDTLVDWLEGSNYETATLSEDPLEYNATIMAENTASFIYDWGIASAMEIFSRHFPLVIRKSVTGNGTGVYDTPLGWVNEFSRLVNVEYPTGQNPPSYMDNDTFGIYQSDIRTWQIMLYGITVPATSSFILYFTGKRDTTQISVLQLEPFVWLAAGYILKKTAIHYVSSTKSSLSADSVNWSDKISEYILLGDTWIKEYEKIMGVNKGQASFYVGHKSILYPGGIDRLTHPRLSRMR